MTLRPSWTSGLPAISRQNPALVSRIDGEPMGSNASAGSLLRVLVVDDNADFADSLALLLRWHDYAVRTEYDARAALDTAIRFRPHAALLDLSMPGMSGFDLARALRGAEATRATKLIAITGLGSPEDRARSREVGFDHHLLKTTDFDAIDRLLRSIGQEHGPLP